MRDWFSQIPEIPFLAVVAMSSGRVVAALDAHSSAPPTGQQINFFVKADICERVGCSYRLKEEAIVSD